MTQRMEARINESGLDCRCASSSRRRASPERRSEIISDVATVAAIIIGDPSRLHQVHGYGGDVHLRASQFRPSGQFRTLSALSIRRLVFVHSPPRLSLVTRATLHAHVRWRLSHVRPLLNSTTTIPASPCWSTS